MKIFDGKRVIIKKYKFYFVTERLIVNTPNKRISRSSSSIVKPNE